MEKRFYNLRRDVNGIVKMKTDEPVVKQSDLNFLN